MIKFLMLVLSLAFGCASFAQEYISNVYFTNQSPNPIKVYGDGIVYYELIQPSKSGRAYVKPLSQIDILRYRVLTESGQQIAYNLPGSDKECKVRWSFVEYQSNDDKPGKFELKRTYCEPEHP